MAADAEHAALRASSVTLTAHIGSSSDDPIGAKLTLAGSSGAKGTVTTHGFPFQVVRKGKAYYFRATDSFWRRQGGSRAVRLLGGRWIKGPEHKPGFRSFLRLTSMKSFFRVLEKKSFLADVGNGGLKTYRGRRVIALYGSGADGGDSFYFSAVGKPYPVAFVGTTKGQPITVRFTGWNRPVSIAPPKHPLDLSKLRSRAGSTQA
ncbi:MAG TPA: hypothetical protein VFM43_04425 [Gaiellaceae bacterium]|nr:hypothetical protein [Gaiellaceae bacterium]